MGIRKNCCPSYFFNQFNTGVLVPPPPNMPVDVIEVDVITETMNERVRIDSMLFAFIFSNSEGDTYGFQIAFRLSRDDTELALVALTNLAQVKQAGFVAFNDDTVNITWTDIPGAPGTYTYRITAERLVEENISAVNVGTRSIDAIVFPAVNP